MKEEKIIALTGASGNMGVKVTESLLSVPYIKLRILFLDTMKDRRLARKWKKRYRNRIDTFFGNVGNISDCERLVVNADYVINMAAVIPPQADHDHASSEEANSKGVENIVKAVEKNGETKLVHISSVAIYGNRNYLHPWGRVGDPLLPSAYDVYAMAKLFGERAVLDSDIKNWVILRQTGILYDKLLMNNVSDGLMFHTCFNTPIEWVTDVDTAKLIKNIITQDVETPLGGFWNKVYNIGGGKNYRTTGYGTFNAGFALIGGGVEDFLQPEWQALRNFHCMWFEDGNVLEEKFHFRNSSLSEFWTGVAERNKYMKAAKFIPVSVIRKVVFERLLKNSNAPLRWVRDGNYGRINAFYGSIDNFYELKKGWERFPLIEKGDKAFGDFDYEKALDESKIAQNGYRLNHGFDEEKPISELDIRDMQRAAAFRGGECLSTTMIKGDLYTKLKWRCSEGHEFYATPYAVLFAGHWCNECLSLYKWNFDALAKKNPFYAEVWYDSHEKKENYTYYFDENGHALIKEGR